MISTSQSPAEPAPEMVELIQRLINGEASSQEVELLNDPLREDPELLSYFVEMRLLHGALENEFEKGISTFDHATARTIPFPTADSPEHCVVQSRFAGQKLAMVAALLLLATLAAFWGVSNLLHRPALEVVATQATQSTNPSGTIARGEWVKTRQTIELEQGVVELNSADGNRFVFEGPGSLTVHHTGELTLGSGKLWASLEGESVLIHTPRGEVRDIGTIFGIDASTSSALRIDVFDGRVRLSNSEDKTQAVEAGKGESLVSQGSNWQPQRGVADASRYISSIRPEMDSDIQAQPQPAAIALLDSGWHATKESSVITDGDLGNLDLTGASKLVVTVAVELKEGDAEQPTEWEVSYNGEAMILAGEGPKSRDDPRLWFGIYYLDNPASVGPGDLVVHHPVRELHASALVLSGSAEGVGHAVGAKHRSQMDVSSGAMVVASSAMMASSGRFLSDEPFSYIHKAEGYAGGQGRRILISASAQHLASSDEIVSPSFPVAGKAISDKTMVLVRFLPASGREN